MTHEDDLEVFVLAEEIADRVMREVQALGGIKPVTPAQAQAKRKKKDKAAADLRDTQATNAIKLGKAQRKLNDI